MGSPSSQRSPRLWSHAGAARGSRYRRRADSPARRSAGRKRERRSAGCDHERDCCGRAESCAWRGILIEHLAWRRGWRADGDHQRLDSERAHLLHGSGGIEVGQARHRADLARWSIRSGGRLRARGNGRRRGHARAAAAATEMGEPEAEHEHAHERYEPDQRPGKAAGGPGTMRRRNATRERAGCFAARAGWPRQTPPRALPRLPWRCRAGSRRFGIAERRPARQAWPSAFRLAVRVGLHLLFDRSRLTTPGEAQTTRRWFPRDRLVRRGAAQPLARPEREQVIGVETEKLAVVTQEAAAENRGREGREILLFQRHQIAAGDTRNPLGLLQRYATLFACLPEDLS